MGQVNNGLNLSGDEDLQQRQKLLRMLQKTKAAPFSEDQIRLLEEEFQQGMDRDRVVRLAKTFGIPRIKVQMWVNNRKTMLDQEENLRHNMPDHNSSDDEDSKNRLKNKLKRSHSECCRTSSIEHPLEKEFYRNYFITIFRKSELGRKLGLSERSVKIWFQNRRYKFRMEYIQIEKLYNEYNITQPY